MKKFIFILAVIFAFCGCSAETPALLEEPKTPAIKPGYGVYSEQQKIFLPLENFYPGGGIELPETAEIDGRRTEIPLVLPENSKKTGLVTVELWPELIAEIRMDYPEFDPDNAGWVSVINFFTEDGTAAILKINYYIADNIITDKAIIGTIENGVIVRLNYTNIDFETDEEAVVAKAENFLDATTQTKKIFEEGEEFLGEETLFHYHYPIETLVYSYQLYFLYGPEGEQVINNDWGYECIVE